MQDDFKFITDFQPVIDNIRKEAKHYLINNGIRSVVLGVSGGIDSAIVAALIRPVCDQLAIPLIGVSLPSTSNKSDEIVRANNIGEHFCHPFSEVPINNMFFELTKEMEILDNNQPETPSEQAIRRGNIKARIRMIYLYNLAQRQKGLVLSTDNYTELMLGFWTIAGDIGDLGLIQNLWKTEVYNMAEFLCDGELKGTNKEESLRACIDCHATDGLGVSKSDLDQILPDWGDRHTTTRSGYQEVDRILYGHLFGGGGLYQYPEQDKIIERHHRTEFKRNHPYNISRENLIK